ncbi:MAG: hypothetical protein R6X12_01710 [bacterium]
MAAAGRRRGALAPGRRGPAGYREEKLSRSSALSVVLAGVLAAFAQGAGRELVLNGDFECSPFEGWREQAWGEFTDTGNCRLGHRPDLDPDPDFEVVVHKLLNAGYALYQQVPVSGVDLGFGVSCRLTSKTENRDYYAAAAVCLEYRDAGDSLLGETRIFSATTGHPWRDSPTLHLIGASDSLNWHEYRFNVAEELANLPGVAPGDIRSIRVVLLAYVDRNG